VYAFDEPCDMRKSFDTLTALVVEHMRHDVLAGDVYLFISRDRKRAKALYQVQCRAKREPVGVRSSRLL
jgi:transposase